MYTHQMPFLFDISLLSSQCYYFCPAIEVAEDLRKYILEIYGDFLSPDGFVSTINLHCSALFVIFIN